jgi:hypothetical protein
LMGSLPIACRFTCRLSWLLWPFPVSDITVWFGFCFQHYGWAWFIFLTQDSVEIILDCFVGSVHPQTLPGAQHQFLIRFICFLVIHLLLYFHCANTCDFITTLPVVFSFAAISFGRLHFDLDVNPILMHLAGFSCSMHNWVVCWNLPCSKTCCWHNKNIFKGVTLHLLARIIAWSPVPAEIKLI